MNLTTMLDRLRSSFWFVPAIMTAGAVVLAFVMVNVDELVTGRGIVVKGWANSGGAEGASSVLGTIAGSMITIAGVVFSLTLVALSLTASQLGPRVLSSFMRDRAVQVVLGTFVATFLYCLLILRTVRRVEESAFVPQISVSLAMVLAVLSLSVLIYFIHHVSVSIQADEIISRVYRELETTIPNMFPSAIGRDGPPEWTSPASAGIPEDVEREGRVVTAGRDGYIQHISSDTLMDSATDNSIVISLHRRPGHYVLSDSPLALVWPGERLTDEVAARIRSSFIIGSRRSPSQDVEFSVNQLVEIAVRALSPGINDPFTAVACIDRIGSMLCRVARQQAPSPYRIDERGVLRIVAEPLSFDSLANAALHQIRQNARGIPAVSIRMLEMIEMVGHCLNCESDRAALRAHAASIVSGALEATPAESDRLDLERRYAGAITALQSPNPEIYPTGRSSIPISR